MDPFGYLPSVVFDQILQNFSGKEILKLSEVSPLWDEAVGNSLVAMQKIKINISWHPNESFFGEISEVMVKSPRKYQNLEFLHQSSYLNSIKSVCDILAVQGRQWKSIKLKRISFQSVQEIRKLFDIISPTIEKIQIHEIHTFQRRENSINGLKFPKLKSLRIKHSDLFFINAFMNCQNIRELSITSGDPQSPAVEAFKQILSNNDLNSLEISSNLFKHVFEDNKISSKIKFKLKSFVARELFKITKNIDLIRKNFHNFLESQTDTLETLSVDEWMGLEVLKLMLHLPKLKSLSINGLNNIQQTANLSLRTNNSIKSLSFHDIDPMLSVFKSLIIAVPKLEYLEMHSVDQKSMEFLSTHANHLNSLKLRTLEATDFSSPQLFSTLQHFSIDVIQSDLEDVIVSIPLEQQNRLVKLLLQSSYTILH